MKNIYLYGASDDCHEVDTDFNNGFEAYGDIAINDIVAHYEYDGDWGVMLVGEIPDNWIVKCVSGNAPSSFRNNASIAGQFIHIQVPDDEKIKFSEVDEEDE